MISENIGESNINSLLFSYWEHSFKIYLAFIKELNMNLL